MEAHGGPGRDASRSGNGGQPGNSLSDSRTSSYTLEEAGVADGDSAGAVAAACDSAEAAVAAYDSAEAEHSIPAGRVLLAPRAP